MSVFTARHYEVVAAQLNAELRSLKRHPEISADAEESTHRLARRFAGVFLSDNFAFDGTRFFDAVNKGV